MIGFYVHHHGAGHFSRTLAVLRCLSEPAVVFSTLAIDPCRLPVGTRVVRLPDDRVEVGAPDGHAGDVADIASLGLDPTGGGALHWAPLGHAQLQRRSGMLTDWFSSGALRWLVCDVSVEVALLARLCGVAPIVVRDPGRRNDRPHRSGFDVAAAMLAPFPVEWEHPDTSLADRARTFYGGLYGLASGRRPDRGAARARFGLAENAPVVVIALGGGGHTFQPGQAGTIAASLPGWEVVVAGPYPAGALAPRARCIGWTDDLFAWLCAADVVVGHGGANLVAEVAAADRPFVCVPEARPHDEQRCRADRLAALGAAVVVDGWPATVDWPDLLDAAVTLGSARLHHWARAGSPERVARWLEHEAPCVAAAIPDLSGMRA